MQQDCRAVRRSGRGFTLIEVMIAIAIVVALVGIVAVNVMGSRKQAKGGIAQIEMANLQQALENFNLTFDRYPTEEEGLAVLWDREALQTDDEATQTKWRRFLQKPSPNDQWGRPWNYRPESEHEEDYDLWSNGPDGEEGTADDIVSWPPETQSGAAPTTGQ